MRGHLGGERGMDDNKIVELYWERNEKAIDVTQKKYGGFCYSIAYNILHNKEDSDESVNDTFLGAWNSIPPHRPQQFSAYLGKLTRNISLNKLRQKNADKRGNGEVPLTLDELQECIPSKTSVDDAIQVKELSHIINSFLRTLSQEERMVFVRRYWYFDSVSDIARKFGFGESKVKMMLMRTRQKLLKKLEKGGYNI